MSMQTPRWAWRDGLTVLALMLAWLAATAWMRPLMLPDEGRYATVAWEMLRSGDWLIPTLNGLPFFHKPPLFYWITGAALSVLGPTEMAARAASLAGATLGALSLYLFTRRWCGPQAARRALWVLLVQPLFYVGGQFANLDMLVAGCITATILALAHAALCFEQQPAPGRRNVVQPVEGQPGEGGGRSGGSRDHRQPLDDRRAPRRVRPTRHRQRRLADRAHPHPRRRHCAQRRDHPRRRIAGPHRGGERRNQRRRGVMRIAHRSHCA